MLYGGIGNITTIKPLQLLQKMVITIIVKEKHDAPIALLFNIFKILRVNDIFYVDCQKYMHEQYLHNPLLLFTLFFKYITSPPETDTIIIRAPFLALEAQRRFVTCYGCSKWHDLPDHIYVSAIKPLST